MGRVLDKDVAHLVRGLKKGRHYQRIAGRRGMSVGECGGWKPEELGSLV